MSEDNLKDTSNQNPNNTGPALVGRKNFMEDPTMQVGKGENIGTRLHEKHKELNIPEPNVDEASKKANKSEDTSTSPIQDTPSSDVDDSIVDASVPPPPNMTVDSPAAKLIKEKTYNLPVHRGANKTKFKIILMIWFVACVVMGSVYVLVF